MNFDDKLPFIIIIRKNTFRRNSKSHSEIGINEINKELGKKNIYLKFTTTKKEVVHKN